MTRQIRWRTLNAVRLENLERRIQLSAVSFSTPAYLALSGGSSSIATADFNGDGKADLVAAVGGGSSHLTVFLGNGDGTFQSAQTIPTAAGLVAVAAGDVNGDGRPDLVTSYSGSDDINVLLGNGDGTFQAPINVGHLMSDPSEVVLSDVNGDGRADVLASYFQTDSDGYVTFSRIAVFIANGNGTFQPPQVLNFNDPIHHFVTGDFNHDGKVDLAATGYVTGYAAANVPDPNALAVRLGNGDGTFGASAIYPLGQPPGAIVAGDLNGDGNTDLAVATPDALEVFSGNGDPEGTFGSPRSFSLGALQAVTLAVADVNGDGHQDLIFTGNTSGVLLGNGAGTFQAAENFPAAANAAAALAIADFNGDGRPDIADSAAGDQRVSIVLNNSSGTFPTIGLAGGTLTINGSPGDDSATVTVSGEILYAQVNETSDTFDLGSVTSLNVHMFGGSDSVNLGAGTPPAFVGGMAGSDTIVATLDNHADTVRGGGGADSMVGGLGISLLFGDSGNDTLVAGSGATTLRGNAGNDSLGGEGGGADVLSGGPGSDTLLGSPSVSIHDTLVGGIGNDSLVKGTNDVLVGSTGNDTVGGFP
jgi:hypothetical protein